MEKEITKDAVKKPVARPAVREHRAPAATTSHVTAAPVARPAAPHAAAPKAAPTHHASSSHSGRYIEATGRRKTAIARVRIFAGNGKVTVNGKDLKGYFTLPRLMAAAISPLEQLNLKDSFDMTVHVSGGGIHAQAEAVRHGLSRAIVLKDIQWKPRLRAMGYMTRDSRMVERKKYGLKKARRAPQWAKR